MTLQVLTDRVTPGRDRVIEFSISSRQIQSLSRIMALAGIAPRGPESAAGWEWDSQTGTVLVVQPMRYQGRIDLVLRMVRDKWHPGFRTADQLQGMRV